MNNYAKICRDTRYHILTRNIKIYRKAFPKNAVYTQMYGVLYVCDNFPNYKGNARNAILKIWVYDKSEIIPVWKSMKIYGNSQNKDEKKLAKKLWIAHLENDHAQTRPIKEKREIKFSQAERMMQDCIRKKKSGGSGQRLIPGIEENDFNNELEWREHSDLAHWEFSGDASMIAISARYEQNCK